MPWTPLLALTLAPLAQDPPGIAPPTGTIAGFVHDQAGAPVAGAFAVLCDRASGLPLGPESQRPFLRHDPEEGHPALEDWWFAISDDAGRFSFDGVRVGRYRVVAQSFPGGRGVEGPLAKHGREVHLRGLADDVAVEAERATRITCAPLGSGTLVYDRGASNDDWYLFLSRGAPTADPVLGPLGWAGPFAQQAIGWSRLAGGRTRVRGVPEGALHFTLFANDCNPCFGADTFEVEPGQTTRRDTNLVGGWSDAIHAPPERLEALTERVAALLTEGGPGAVEHLLAAGREEAFAALKRRRGFAGLFDVMRVLGPLDREVQLPASPVASALQATVADLMAAAGYARLRAR
ncbi:MAG: carboxypeptidase-like regulatory domain-containing protein [Planctomycetota bacterium]|nr:carboxypeptidase-like regulatory domain-containing protein [Planctomycetota bacterium]